jgi:hypothetical protein
MGVIRREVESGEILADPKMRSAAPPCGAKSRSGTYLPVDNSPPLSYDGTVQTIPL